MNRNRKQDEGTKLTPGLYIRGLAVLLVAVAGTWATGALLLERHARDHERQRVRRELENARSAVARRLQATNQELHRAAGAFAGDAMLRQAVATRNREGVAEALRGDVEHGWELLLATDYLGRLLGTAGSTPDQRFVLASAAVDSAVAGDAAETFWVVDRNLFQVRVEPVRSNDQIAGALAVGRRLDRAFLAALRGGVEPHLRLEMDGRILAATTAAGPEEPVGGLVLGSGSGGGNVRLQFIPADPLTDTGLPWGVLSASAALWLLVSMTLGGLLLRSHRDSLAALSRTADRLGRGEMDEPVAVRAQRDVRDVAQALERLRVDLRRKIEDAEGRCRELSGALELERCIGEQQEHRLGRARASLKEQAGRGARELAHELRTPAATVSATMTGVRHGLEHWLGCLQALDLRSLTPEQTRLFHAALEEIDLRTPLGRPVPRVGQQLGEQLRRSGVRDPERAARVLTRTGLVSRWEALVPLLRRRDAAAFLSALEAFGGLQVHLRSGLKAAEVLVQVGRSVSSGVRMKGEEVDVRRGLEDALALLDHELRGRVELSHDLPALPTVQGDGAQLCQVWTNLIHNAVQAMGDQGGELGLEARADQGFLTIAVTDTGPGIDPSVRGKIFEPYVTTKSPGQGSGIGLSVVRRIVEAHGGRISVNSVPGRTRFEVSLPLSGVMAMAATG